MQTVVMLSPPNEVFTVCRNAVAEFGYEASLTRSKIRFMQGERSVNLCRPQVFKSVKRNSLLSAVMAVRSSGGRHH